MKPLNAARSKPQLHGKCLNTMLLASEHGDLMGHIAKVTSKNMVTIPAAIMRKYGIKEGMRVKFIETETGVLMIPIPKLEDLHGIDRQHASAIIEGIRELGAEHRREARE